MSSDRAPELSLRLGRPEISRLVWALAISLLLHLVVFGGYQVGKKYNVWEKLHWPEWVRKSKLLAAIPNPPPQPRVMQEAFIAFDERAEREHRARCDFRERTKILRTQSLGERRHMFPA